MDKSPIRVGFLSQDLNLGDAISRTIGDGFQTRCSNGVDAYRLQEILRWADILLADLRPANSGNSHADFSLLHEIRRVASNPPVVALCEAEDPRAIFEALEHGAHDSLTNPPNMVELRFLLQRTLRHHEAEKELQQLRAREHGAGRLHNLIGSSLPMQEVFALAKKIASCDVNVLITGETGTGKELIARAIHNLGPRSEGPLVAFSCANLPETLVEDELFGHEKGAFTGALAGRQGRVEAADRGTLFLDEIGDLGLGLQPKLLRVLQEKTFERLGSNKTVSVDVRLISATNRNLADMVQQGKFREDLFYRLNVVEVHLPALRERRDDIPLLAQHFLHNAARQYQKRVKSISPQVVRALEEHAWPGNVRELENVIQRAVVLSDGPTLELSHLPAALRSAGEQTRMESSVEEPRLSHSYEEEIRRFKRSLVLRTLREYGWSKAESARALGVARGYLHRLINQLGIHEDEGAASAESGEHQVPVEPVM